MILRPQQIHLLRLGHPVTPANGGGSSSSQQATNTSTKLTNNVSSTDSRSVASDHAIALGGAGDSVVQNSSTANTTSNSGNTTSSSGNANSGNTSFSSTTVNTVTDFGSVQAALDGMKTTASRAMGVSGDMAGTALAALSDQSANTMTLLGNIFQYAQASSANSQGTAMQALGMANNSSMAANLASSDEASHAYTSSKKLTQMMIAAGVLIAVLIFRK